MGSAAIVSLLGGWLAGSWPYVLSFFVLALIVYLLLRLMTGLRDRTEHTLQQLLSSSPARYVERLENNSRLRWIYRKPIRLLYLLDGYMKLGDDGKAAQVVQALDSMRLEPQDKVEFYQKRLSYFVLVGNEEEARSSCDKLVNFLGNTGADKVPPYKDLAEEAKTIVSVYVDHDTSLIKKLTSQAEHTKQPVLRGITQFRIAKLAYFQGDTPLMEKYLTRAEKNLRGTYYELVIAEAREDPKILEVH